MSTGAPTDHESTGHYLRRRSAVAAAIGFGLLAASVISGMVLDAPGEEVSMRTAPAATWSPMTAITAWWSERAADVYESPDAVHLPRCDDAEGIATTGQTVLCSTLVEDLGETRVYDSGRAGAPADVRITVVEQPDHTWAVTETLAR